MSSKSPGKRFVKIEYKEEEDLDLKRVVIPFSYYFRKDERFIYDGSEKIPFSKRNASYRSILLQEFGEKVRSVKKN